MNGKYLRVVSAVIVTAALAGCSGGGGNAAPTKSGVASSGAARSTAATSPPASLKPTPAASSAKPSPQSSATKTTAVCPATGWDAALDTSGSTELTKGELFDVRPGRHACFDRVVFDVSGTRADFRVGYVPVVGYEGSGDAVPVAGAADLQVTLYAPSPELFAGFGWKGDYPSLKEIRFAGTSEGMTTFAVGVATKRPFAVESWRQGDVTRVVLDIAH